MSMSGTAFALAHREGEALWFNHDLLVFRATSEQTDGAFILFEQTSQRAKTTPLHRHAEDETFYVLEGELVVHIDGTDHPGKPGSIIVLPRQTPHAFRAKPVRTGSERQAIQPPATSRQNQVRPTSPASEQPHNSTAWKYSHVAFRGLRVTHSRTGKPTACRSALPPSRGVIPEHRPSEGGPASLRGGAPS